MRSRRGGGRLGALVVAALMIALGVAPALAGAGAASAARAAADREVVFRFADPEIVEASGLAVTDAGFVTVNDSGDEGRIFVVDPTSGRTVGQVRWGEATDVEAVAPMPDGHVLVGDLGDNLGERDEISLIDVVPRADDLTVEPTRFRLRYPDGPKDAESLLVNPRSGRVLVASKGLFAGTLYVAPKSLSQDRVNRLRAVGQVIGVATDGAFFPDGRHLVLRSYSRATIYSWPGLDEVTTIRLPVQRQGEAIAVDADGQVFVTSEGADAEVLRVRLPRSVRAVVTPEPVPQPAPGPSGSGGAGAAGPEQPERPVDESDPLSSWLPWLLVVGAALVVGSGVVIGRRRDSQRDRAP